MRQLGNFQLLLLLTWKNFIILWNNRRELFFDILLPVIFWIGVIIIRIAVDPRPIPDTIFEPIDLAKEWHDLIALFKYRREVLEGLVANFTHDMFVPQLIIAYAPSDYKDFEKIMKHAIAILGDVTLIGFHSCSALQEKMQSEHYLAGVCFHDIVSYDYANAMDVSYEFDENDKLDNLNYTIVMPSELRIYDDSIVGFTWLTNKVFTLLSENRMEGPSDGGYLGYTREGFIPLQVAINRGFFKYRLGETITLPNVTLQRFPVTAQMHDEMIALLPLTLGLLVVLGFLCPVVRITWRIGKEKQTTIKSYLQASGVSNWIYYVSWFLHGLFIFLCNAIVLSLILSLNWNNTYSILTDSSPIAVFVFIMAYCVYASAYSILIASVFSSGFLAATVAGLIWIITTIPTIAFADHRRVMDIIWVLFYSFPNSAMGLITFRILEDEVNQNGFKFDDIISNSYPFVEINAGYVMVLLVGHSAIYIILVLIIGKIKPKYTNTSTTLHSLLMKSDRRRVELTPALNTFETESTKVFEIEAVYRKQLVGIDNLSKSYQNVDVVKRVSLNLYENNITVLLGHNGSGKSTLLKMIMGIESFTEGKIIIEDFDFSLLSHEYRPKLGASLRDYLLFDDLTVENQISFYSRLKGMTWKQSRLQVEKYCRAMDLMGKRKVIAKNLTVGLRHQLAVCCAFAGESKIVILDEPNYGMDLKATRQVLELIEAEKQNRTILLSTNSTKIADTIADRVAIMSKGELKCSGSIVFLKNIYSYGQRLSIIKGRECRTERITEFLQEYMPDIVVESQLGLSLNYLINNRYTDMIGAVLERMDIRSDKLGIETFALEDLSIDDVVMSIGTNYPDDLDPHRQMRILNGETPYVDAAYEAFNAPFWKDRSRAHTFRALFLSRSIFTFRNKSEIIMHMLMPAFCIVVMFIFNRSMLTRDALKPIFFLLERYEQTQTIAGKAGKLTRPMQYMYDLLYEMIFWLPTEHQIREIGENSIIDYVLKVQRDDMPLFNHQTLVGVVLSNDSVDVFFNNFAYHGAPLAINIGYNAIARALVDKYSMITVKLQNLPFVTASDSVPLFRQHNMNISVVLSIMLGCLFSWNASVYYITLQRFTRFRLLIQIAGAKIRDIWLCTFIFDMGRNVILITFVILAMYACNHQFMNSELMGYTYLSLFLGCVAIHSTHYVFARLLRSPIASYNAVLLYDCLGIIAFSFMSELSKFYEQQDEYQEAEGIFIWHPYFAMGSMLQTLYVNNRLRTICSDPVLKVVFDYLKDNKNPKCSNIPHLFSDNGILGQLISLSVLCGISWALIFIIEYNKKWLKFWIFGVKHDVSDYSWDDYVRVRRLTEPDDVERERIKLDTQHPVNMHDAPLVLNRVGKTFGLLEALHRLCFFLDRCNICGVLGSNGSGKSILLDMINTSTRISYGQITVKGVNVAKDPFKVHKHIGYCPESLEALHGYTPCEIMEIFAMLRGIPLQRIPGMCECIAKVLGFYGDYDRLIRTCSLGIQKRIGCAVAMIGQPELILMDEPMSAVDTYGKLLLRNVLSRVSRNGSTVLFTSSSPQECQLFCDKLIIIMNGHLIAGGSLQDVFRGDNYGYELIIRIKPLPEVSTTYNRNNNFRFRTSDAVKLRLMALVQSSFKNVILRHAGELVISFIIPRENSVGLIYSTVQANAFSYNIEGFGIFRSSMEMIYLHLFDRAIY